jgi:hypothetical protein
VNRVEAELSRQLDAAGRREIELRTLPADTSAIREHGLLYLPHPYVVPAGASTRCTAGIATSSSSACYATTRWPWRRT